jgi:PAS domain S-box-containing protein
VTRTIGPTNVEVFSKTDLKGRLTYVNRTFCDIAEYTEQELIGAPHSIIRHPDMPRAVTTDQSTDRSGPRFCGRFAQGAARRNRTIERRIATARRGGRLTVPGGPRRDHAESRRIIDLQ